MRKSLNRVMRKSSDQESEESDTGTEIQFDGFESRITMLPVPAGNIGGLMTFDGKVAYMRYPNSGSMGGPPVLQAYDFEEQEEITIMEGVGSAVQSADGKSILVSAGNQYGIIQPQAGQSIEEPITTDGLVMQLVVEMNGIKYSRIHGAGTVTFSMTRICKGLTGMKCAIATAR